MKLLLTILLFLPLHGWRYKEEKSQSSEVVVRKNGKITITNRKYVDNAKETREEICIVSVRKK